MAEDPVVALSNKYDYPMPACYHGVCSELVAATGAHPFAANFLRQGEATCNLNDSQVAAAFDTMVELVESHRPP